LGATSLKSKALKLKKISTILIETFFEHDIGRSAASLAYYLIFTLFPLLIFINNLLGLLNLDISEIISVLQLILPKDIVEIISTYLKYISQTSSQVLFWFSLIFSIYFPMRTSKSLMDSVRRAYHLKKPKKPLLYIVRQFVYTMIFFLTITIVLLMIITGHEVLSYIISLFSQGTGSYISEVALTLWDELRFVFAAIAMFFSLAMLYRMAQDEKTPLSSIIPGAVVALIAWLLVSSIFSFYVENFANYSIIYGTLGAIIILLIWLYVTSIILILGGELNAALLRIKEAERKNIH